MNEVFIGATNYMVVGDCNGIDTAPRGLEHMNALQRANVPNLRGKKHTLYTKFQVNVTLIHTEHT